MLRHAVSVGYTGYSTPPTLCNLCLLPWHERTAREEVKQGRSIRPVPGYGPESGAKGDSPSNKVRMVELIDRHILESYADGCRSLFSPIRRLPAELLADIFELCLPREIYQILDTTIPEQEVDRISGRHLLQLAWYPRVGTKLHVYPKTLVYCGGRHICLEPVHPIRDHSICPFWSSSARMHPDGRMFTSVRTTGRAHILLLPRATLVSWTRSASVRGGKAWTSFVMHLRAGVVRIGIQIKMWIYIIKFGAERESLQELTSV
ncbi:hypothetical protein K438DRAFT_1759119 [Mycena galopus ATCC 62051]|nr:hypothetical protein K438DRAFT_1759119 [Mycena galopus ATCC 62051]